MKKFELGDIVRFKGDDVDYELSYKNSDGTCDLIRVGGNEAEIECVPVRLIEYPPVAVEVGQVWESHDPDEEKYRLFVTRVDGEDDVTYVTNWGKLVYGSKGTSKHIREHYTLILKGVKS